jgi:hypothetical protein
VRTGHDFGQGKSTNTDKSQQVCNSNSGTHHPSPLGQAPALDPGRSGSIIPQPRRQSLSLAVTQPVTRTVARTVTGACGHPPGCCTVTLPGPNIVDGWSEDDVFHAYRVPPATDLGYHWQEDAKRTKGRTETFTRPAQPGRPRGFCLICHLGSPPLAASVISVCRWARAHTVQGPSRRFAHHVVQGDQT